MTPAERMEHLVKYGKESQESFSSGMKALTSFLKGHDPLAVLSTLAFYGLTSGVSESGVVSRPTSMEQHEVELVQALVLRHHPDEFELEPLFPHEVKDMWGMVKTVSRSFHARRFQAVQECSTKVESALHAAIEGMRLRRQCVRNWGYPHQVRMLAQSLWGSFSGEVEALLGARPELLFKMWEAIEAQVVKRLNQRFQRLKHVLRASTCSGVLNAYQREFGASASVITELAELTKGQGVDQLRSMIRSFLDQSISELYCLELDEFIAAYPAKVSREALTAILRRWSLSFGELHQLDPEHIFMGNPVWKRPLIELDSGRFFCPIVTLYFSFWTDMLEDLTSTAPELHEKYYRRRAGFLEERLEHLFVQAFPGATVCRGSLWRDCDRGIEYENDLLVVIDSAAIILEAKAGKVSEPAHRGSTLRLQRDLNELLVAPSVQAFRFRRFLEQNPSLHTFRRRDGQCNSVDTRGVKVFACANITLERIGQLGTHTPQLKEGELVPTDAELAPTIPLPDLEIIFEMLESQGEKLHFLLRRTDFEKHAFYYADDLDLLALYWDNGLCMGEKEYDGTKLMLWSSSDIVDDHYSAVEHGLSHRKPRRRMTKWWTDILAEVERRRIPRWTELSCFLRNIDYESQQSFEAKFRRTQRHIRQSDQLIGMEDCVVLVCGPTQRRDVVVGLAYRDLAKHDRDQRLANAAGLGIERSTSRRVTVIGINVLKPVYPYNVIGVFE